MTITWEPGLQSPPRPSPPCHRWIHLHRTKMYVGSQAAAFKEGRISDAWCNNNGDDTFHRQHQKQHGQLNAAPRAAIPGQSLKTARKRRSLVVVVVVVEDTGSFRKMKCVSGGEAVKRREGVKPHFWPQFRENLNRRNEHISFTSQNIAPTFFPLFYKNAWEEEGSCTCFPKARTECRALPAAEALEGTYSVYNLCLKK